MTARLLPRTALALLGLLVMAVSLSVARSSEGRWLPVATDGWWPSALYLAAGFSLLLAGTLTRSVAGVLFWVAGCCWLTTELDVPGAVQAAPFVAGRLVALVTPVVLADAVLRWMGTPTSAERVVTTLAYLSTLAVGGLGPVVFHDPSRGDCGTCPVDPLLLHESPTAAMVAADLSSVAGLVWPVLLCVVPVRRLMEKAPGARRALWPTVAASTTYVALVWLASLDRVRAPGGEAQSGSTLWTASAVVVLVAGLGTIWPVVDLRLTRLRLDRLLVRTARTTSTSGLTAAVRLALHDPGASVLFPTSTGELVDGSGEPAEPPPGSGTTPVTRSGETVAFLVHRPGAVTSEGAVERLAEAAWLFLDHDRLLALEARHLEELRASRRRIVERADEERCRLERDLHDGAQQRLVTLTLALRLAILRSGAGSQVGPLEQAQAELGHAMAALRTVAHGIFPRELADEGLEAALETLAEVAPARIELDLGATDRFPPRVGSTAYWVASRCASVRTGDGSDDAATVCLRRAADTLTITATLPQVPADLEAIRDRVGAVDGTVTLVGRPDARVLLRAELPCES
jgi:signal transduction histidine kinase